MLHVTSTVPDYLQLQNLKQSERQAVWLSQYEETHADLFDIYYSAYGHPTAAGQQQVSCPIWLLTSWPESRAS